MSIFPAGTAMQPSPPRTPNYHYRYRRRWIKEIVTTARRCNEFFTFGSSSASDKSRRGHSQLSREVRARRASGHRRHRRGGRGHLRGDDRSARSHRTGGLHRRRGVERHRDRRVDERPALEGERHRGQRGVLPRRRRDEPVPTFPLLPDGRGGGRPSPRRPQGRHRTRVEPRRFRRRRRRHGSGVVRR